MFLDYSVAAVKRAPLQPSAVKLSCITVDFPQPSNVHVSAQLPFSKYEFFRALPLMGKYSGSEIGSAFILLSLIFIKSQGVLSVCLSLIAAVGTVEFSMLRNSEGDT